MKRKRSNKSLFEMTTQELADATAEFDQEFIADTFVPMTPEAQALWEKAKRKPGEPRNGPASQVISVSIENDLLKRSDALARKMRISRANLIARGLRAVLAAEGQS